MDVGVTVAPASCLLGERMQRTIANSLILFVLISHGFAAVLTEDNQVVIPTGQPFPVEQSLQKYPGTNHRPDLIFQWDTGSSSIVFIKDELSHSRVDARKLEKDLLILQRTLDMRLTGNFKINGKTISINVNLE
jgi:hypothetical protein